jgi:hypothetical protein
LKKLSNGGKNMSKKILSVALALIFVLSTFAVSAFAVGGTGYEAKDATYKQTWALEATDNGNGTWTVDVKLTATAPEKETYAVGAIQFTVLNSNPAGAVLTSVEPGAALVEDYGADIQANLAKGTVAIIPNPAEDATTGLDLSKGGVIATLTYTVSAGATLSIDGNDAKTKSNPGGGLIAVRMSDNTLTTGDMIYGQIVDTTAATANLGSVAATPELKGVETGYVDADRKYVYGVPAGENATAFFTVENGSFEITGTFTGAVLTVKDAAGTAVDTYTLIIFGDVNGDGAVTAADYAIVNMASLGGSIDGEANTFAGDVNGDGAVTAADYAIVNMASLGGAITVNPYAA